jgi:hypothetical protein
MSGSWKRWLVVWAVCAFALLLPGVAQAAPNWVRVADPAPGGTIEWEDGYPKVDLAIADGTPYLAARERRTVGNDVTVWRPNHAGTAWVQVGGTLNHAAPPDHWAGPAIAADSATPWVTWEEGADGAAHIHVARLDGTAWKEPVSSSQTANWPQPGGVAQLVVFGGRPYLTVGSSDVARLNAAGNAVEHVTAGLPSGCVPSLTVSGGRLYTPCGKELMRLNGTGTAWQHVVTNTDPFFLVDVTHTLYLLKNPCCSSAIGGEIFKLTPSDQLEEVFAGDGQFDRYFAGFKGSIWAARSGDTPGPDALGPVTMRSLASGRWWSAPSPSLTQEGALVVKFFEDADGALWLLWHSHDPSNSVGPPRHVHVARFAEQGTPFDFAPDPVTMPPDDPPSGPPEPPPPDPDDGGYTDPGGDPVPPDDSGPPPLLPGACKNLFTGTARADRIVGSRFGDRILGRDGNDRLYGRGGSDCIAGGAGADVVNGDTGPDALSGEGGNDRIAPGDGRDDVSGGAGNDSIDAVGGGVDRVNCGAGRDTVRVSGNDLIKGCEHVIVRAAARKRPVKR